MFNINTIELIWWWCNLVINKCNAYRHFKHFVIISWSGFLVMRTAIGVDCLLRQATQKAVQTIWLWRQPSSHHLGKTPRKEMACLNVMIWIQLYCSIYLVKMETWVWVSRSLPGLCRIYRQKFSNLNFRNSLKVTLLVLSYFTQLNPEFLLQA